MKKHTIPILRIPFTDEDLESIKDGITKVLKSGQLTMGENVIRFEKEFAKFCGTKHAIATNSGTSALEMAFRALKVNGSSVIVPTNTFMATASSVIHAGGKIIFADVMKDNLCLDPEELEDKVQRSTKGVCLVHIGGIITPHLDRIKRLCEDNNLFLLEDAAHAHGATINLKKAGSLGDAAAFSFYPTKVMTCGEGGVLTTNSDEIREMVNTLRDHGKPDHNLNVHTEFGYNWRLSEIHAVIALQQMNKVNWLLAERRKVAKFYDEKLKNVSGITTIKLPDNVQPSYHKYIAYLADEIDRAEVKKSLKEKFEVSLTGEVYADPLHLQPVFKKYPATVLNKKSDRFPVAEYVAKRHICLPIYPGLSEEEVDYVVEALRSVL